MFFKVCQFVFSSLFLNISTVAGVVGQLRVGAAVGRRVPYVQVHVGPEWVEAGVLEPVGPLRLPVEGRVRRGDGGHGEHGGRSLRWEVALGRPDGAEQAGHGGQAASTREVWLEDESGEVIRSEPTEGSSCGHVRNDLLCGADFTFLDISEFIEASPCCPRRLQCSRLWEIPEAAPQSSCFDSHVPCDPLV